MTRRRFILANGRRNEAAIEEALQQRLQHYKTFNEHIPGVMSADQWRLDVIVALEAEIVLEGIQNARLKEMN